MFDQYISDSFVIYTTIFTLLTLFTYEVFTFYRPKFRNYLSELDITFIDAFELCQRVMRNYVKIFDNRSTSQIFTYPFTDDVELGVIVLDLDGTRRVLPIPQSDSPLVSMMINPPSSHPLNILRPLDKNGLPFQVYLPNGVEL